MLTARDFSDLSYAEKEHLLDVLRASRGLLAGAFGPPDSAADDAVFPLALPPAEPDSVPTPFSDRSILTDALGALAHVSQGALAESLLQEGLDADSAEPIDPLPLLKAASVLIDGCLARLGYRKDGTVEPPSSYDGFSARELLVLVLGVLAEAKMCEDLGLSGHEGEELANGHANGAAVYENGEGSGSKADSDRHVRQAVELVHSLHDKFFIELYGMFLV